MLDVVAPVITMSSQDGRGGEAGVNVAERRRKGMIRSASLWRLCQALLLLSKLIRDENWTKAMTAMFLDDGSGLTRRR